MAWCPRCRSRTLEACDDVHGAFQECFMCGHVIEPTPPLEWTPWNPRREHIDPIIGAEKIARAKRWRDPERRRGYQRAYKARRRAAARP